MTTRGFPEPEEVLHWVWAEQHFRTEDLRTSDGAAILVEFPGWANRGAGPDFQEARLRIQEASGEWVTHVGAVELHLRSSRWTAHWRTIRTTTPWSCTSCCIVTARCWRSERTESRFQRRNGLRCWPLSVAYSPRQKRFGNAGIMAIRRNCCSSRFSEHWAILPTHSRLRNWRSSIHCGV